MRTRHISSGKRHELYREAIAELCRMNGGRLVVHVNMEGKGGRLVMQVNPLRNGECEIEFSIAPEVNQ